MGYGYGLWLVYEDKELKTEHISHFTVTSFMNRDDSAKLFRELSEIHNQTEIIINGNSEYYYSSFEEHDKNKMCSWGYDGKCTQWKIYRSICNNYECQFTSSPYTSMEYGLYPKLLKPQNIRDKILQCRLCHVDLRSDFPEDWKIIQSC